MHASHDAGGCIEKSDVFHLSLLNEVFLDIGRPTSIAHLRNSASSPSLKEPGGGWGVLIIAIAHP